MVQCKNYKFKTRILIKTQKTVFFSFCSDFSVTVNDSTQYVKTLTATVAKNRIQASWSIEQEEAFPVFDHSVAAPSCSSFSQAFFRTFTTKATHQKRLRKYCSLEKKNNSCKNRAKAKDSPLWSNVKKCVYQIKILKFSLPDIKVL